MKACAIVLSRPALKHARKDGSRVEETSEERMLQEEEEEVGWPEGAGEEGGRMVFGEEAAERDEDLSFMSARTRL